MVLSSGMKNSSLGFEVPDLVSRSQMFEHN